MSARKTRLLLTGRALNDIVEIENYSIAEWGRRTASRYIADIEAALLWVQEQPDLLRPDEDLHPDLRFYRVNKHLLVCDVRPQTIIVLTVIHCSRDIPTRLSELQPMLAAEVDMLHRKLGQRR